MPNPVDMLKRRFAYRSHIKAKITSVTPEGAVASVSEQVEGFIAPEGYGSEGAPREGQEVTAMVVGINFSNFRLTLSIKSCEDVEDRKRMAQYLKGSPSLTLGQILLENSEDEGEL
jgi:ribosomal protein S1